jgi:hypothetical protein
MLSLLLDEHISPVVAEQARRKFPGIRITTLHNWRDGQFLGSSDDVFLPEALKSGLTLGTYDQRTIRPLLKRWMEQDVHHGGVIFVDAKMIAPQDFGGLVTALGRLWKSERRAPWKNRVVFLRRQSA